MKNILFIFGTRPEAIKMAPMIKELQSRPKKFRVAVCVTGQHREMLDQALDFFEIHPDYDLDVMKPGQSLFGVTARILEKIETVIDDFQPNVILVQGDTTTALVGALAGYYKQVDVGHLEAGLRSGDKYAPYPEEMNRVLVAQIARYHFAPTERARDSLKKEGIIADHIHIVGNTVIDALLLGLNIIRNTKSDEFSKAINVDWSKRVMLVTGHRRESFGEGFEGICSAIKRLALRYEDLEIVYPVHLNPSVKEPANRILGGIRNIHLIQPLDYPNLIWVMEKSYLVLTDSGGIQEEAPTLGKPVLVMREVTERQEGIDAGTAKLVGTEEDNIFLEVQKLLNDPEEYKIMANAVNPYGDGTTASQIANILER